MKSESPKKWGDISFLITLKDSDFQSKEKSIIITLHNCISYPIIHFIHPHFITRNYFNNQNSDTITGNVFEVLRI